MKNLLPRALPTTPSLDALGKSEREEKLDCNLPELLARDLELSSSVFVSMDMTAGAPSTVLSIKEAAAAETERALARSASPSSSFQHRRRPGLVRVRSLDAIEEKPSIPDIRLSGGDEKEDGCLVYDTMSESNSSSHSSSALEPPSIRLFDNSIMTATTSLTSASFSVAASFGKPSKINEVHEVGSSWIDADSDMSDSEGRDSSVLELASTAPVGKRRFALRDQSLEDAVSMRPFFVNPLAQHPIRIESEESIKESGLKSRSASRPASRPASRDGPVEIPPRRSSKSQRYSVYLDTHPPKCPTSPIFRPEDSPIQPVPTFTPAKRHTVSEKMITEEMSRMTKSIQAAQHQADEPERIPEEAESEDEDPTELVMRTHKRQPSQASINIQNWLESSIEPVLGRAGDDHAAPGVPLPPNVVESVRVSTTCFPDTMLLTSSLSIETIRAYSRKVKNPNVDLRMPLAPGSPSSSRKWNLSRVLPRRANSTVGSRGRHHQQQNDSDFNDGASMAPTLAPPPWLPLRTIFNCSFGNADYLCDALYSHIVAYNYISTLTRSRPTSPRSLRPNTTHSVSSGHSKEDPTEIPKKAASILGINENPTLPDPIQRGRSSLARKRPAIVAALLPSRESAGIQAAPPTPCQEKADLAMWELQIGLAKCIARLVTTMKKMTGGGEEADGAIGDSTEIDPLFMRSLCEVVKCSEEMQCD